MKRIVAILINVFCLLAVQAQHEYPLKQCLEEGLMNNYSLRITRNEELVSKNNATLANAGYLPTVDLTAGYTSSLAGTVRYFLTDSWPLPVLL